MSLYPLLLRPVLKNMLWGGTKLITQYGRKSENPTVAESWELCCHRDGMSVIENGELSGRTLAEITKMDKGLLGSACERFDRFPVLIKYIDAADILSIQVHPGNEYALANEGDLGKTEMWYVQDCEPGAFLYYGFNREISRDEFAARIQNNTLPEVLNRVFVKPGDTLLVEAGTLHAIGKGILIAEIQQNSNSTYRVYDFGRLDAAGNPRELHAQKALDVTVLKPPVRKPGAIGKRESFAGFDRTLLSGCDWFTVYELCVHGECPLCADGVSFHSLLCLDGGLELRYDIKSLSLCAGSSVFVPANLGDYTLSGTGKALLTLEK
ncbi:MAG: class I mannose-6-phosphate isomerase [Oscillospiraceae bacterium]|jgi:mannose-6-phosphate isomerase|nr:class I mannose-6-phosphate isomerase [Oscillospiraceae bacterium]